MQRFWNGLIGRLESGLRIPALHPIHYACTRGHLGLDSTRRPRTGQALERVHPSYAGMRGSCTPTRAA